MLVLTPFWPRPQVFPHVVQFDGLWPQFLLPPQFLRHSSSFGLAHRTFATEILTTGHVSMTSAVRAGSREGQPVHVSASPHSFTLLSSPLLSSLANCVVAGGSDHANGHTELLTLGLPGELFLLFKTPLPFPETDTAARWNRSPSPAVMFVPIFASSRLEPCCNVQDTKRISERDAHGGIATEGSLELKSRWP